MAQVPEPAAPDPSGSAAPIPLYPGECFHAAVAGRTFLRESEMREMPQLKEEFTRVSREASVLIHNSDQRLEFQVRKVMEHNSQNLSAEDDKMWKGIKEAVRKYGATHQDDDAGYDPLQVLDPNETSNIRVRWVVKNLTPPARTPSTISPELSFESLVWDGDKVRDITSSQASPKNDAEAAAKISEYVRTNSPAPVWWANQVESALNEHYTDAYCRSLRDRRARGLDTGPLRGPTDDYTQALRDRRAQRNQEI